MIKEPERHALVPSDSSFQSYLAATWRQIPDIYDTINSCLLTLAADQHHLNVSCNSRQELKDIQDVRPQLAAFLSLTFRTRNVEPELKRSRGRPKTGSRSRQKTQQTTFHARLTTYQSTLLTELTSSKQQTFSFSLSSYSLTASRQTENVKNEENQEKSKNPNLNFSSWKFHKMIWLVCFKLFVFTSCLQSLLFFWASSVCFDFTGDKWR